MAMEDNVDMRFNDVQFAIMASASSSVEPTPNIPDEVNKGEIFVCSQRVFWLMRTIGLIRMITI